MSYIYEDFELQENNEVRVLTEDVKIRINPAVAQKLSEKTDTDIEICKILLAAISYNRINNASQKGEQKRRSFAEKITEDQILDVIPILLQHVGNIEVVIDKIMDMKYHELLEIFKAEDPLKIFYLYD